MGGFLSYEIEIGDGPGPELDKKVRGGWVVDLEYNVSSGPFLRFGD